MIDLKNPPKPRLIWLTLAVLTIIFGALQAPTLIQNGLKNPELAPSLQSNLFGAHVYLATMQIVILILAFLLEWGLMYSLILILSRQKWNPRVIAHLLAISTACSLVIRILLSLGALLSLPIDANVLNFVTCFHCIFAGLLGVKWGKFTSKKPLIACAIASFIFLMLWIVKLFAPAR